MSPKMWVFFFVLLGLTIGGTAALVAFGKAEEPPAVTQVWLTTGQVAQFGDYELKLDSYSSGNYNFSLASNNGIQQKSVPEGKSNLFGVMVIETKNGSFTILGKASAPTGVNFITGYAVIKQLSPRLFKR